MELRNRNKGSARLNGSDLRSECLLCAKSFKVATDIDQIFSSRKIVNALVHVLNLPKSLSELGTSTNIPPHPCCQACCSNLFDAVRLLKEIKELKQMTAFLITELKRNLKRSWKHSQNGNGELGRIRRILNQSIKDIDTQPGHLSKSAGEDKDSAVLNEAKGTESEDENFSDSDIVYAHSSSEVVKIRLHQSTRKLVKTASPAQSTVSQSSGPASQGISESQKSSSTLIPKYPELQRCKTKTRGPLLWFQCSHCKKSYVKTDFRTDLGSANYVFKCDVESCNRKFYNFAVFQKHHESTCPKRSRVECFKCEVCGKNCSSRQNLERHKVSFHTKEYKYYCDKCGLGLVSRYMLTRHMLCHTDEKKFTCRLCDKSFKRKIQLHYHVMRHTNELPRMCDLCGKRFPSSQKLKCHAATHTKEKMYTCPICDKLFASKRYVDNHIYSAHQKRRAARRKVNTSGKVCNGSSSTVCKNNVQSEVTDV